MEKDGSEDWENVAGRQRIEVTSGTLAPAGEQNKDVRQLIDKMNNFFQTA